MTFAETLVVRRTIAATAERLFAAWTEPAQLRAWWGPRDVRCVGAEVDLRVGGSFRLGNELPDGRLLWIAGTFEEVEPPHRLVYTWRTDDDPDDSRVTVQFVPSAGATARTEVIVTHERVRDAASRASRERGWNGCLDGLAAYVA